MADPKRGYAILGESPQVARFYAAGASVAEGLTLDQVYQDRVILNRNGALETLRMRFEHETIDSQKETLPALARAITVPSSHASAASSNTPGQLIPMKSFQLMPVFGQRDRGARIGMPRNPAQLTQMGLSAGDIITAVNGTPVHSVESAVSLLESLGTAKTNLTVERGTVSRVVQVNSADLLAQ